MKPVINKKKCGKQKIEIKPIIKKTTKQVTFTRRRNRLFKKAGELSSLCGSEVTVITFSPAGNLFSFGHPNADSIVHRYVNYYIHGHENNGNVGNSSNVNEDRGPKMFPCDTEFGFWWDKPIDGLGLLELEQLKASLEGLRDEISSVNAFG